MNKATLLKISILATAISAVLPAAAATSSITFKPVPQASNSVLWVNSVIRPAGIPVDQPATICVTQQVMTYKVGRDTITVALPDAAIAFKPWEAVGTANFSANRWDVSVPTAGAAFESFMGGTDYPSALLPAGSVDVTYTATFTSDVPDVSVQWRWGAATYTMFSDSENALGVVATDMRNLDRAGTPYAFKNYVFGGNDAGVNDYGDTRFTGARSAIKSVAADLSATCGGAY